jgi:hypothetical protein
MLNLWKSGERMSANQTDRRACSLFCTLRSTDVGKPKNKEAPTVFVTALWMISQSLQMASRLWGKKAHNGAHLEADDEELAEQRLYTAAKRIQQVYRARRARRSLRAMVKANFVKEYDRHVRFGSLHSFLHRSLQRAVS